MEKKFRPCKGCQRAGTCKLAGKCLAKEKLY